MKLLHIISLMTLLAASARLSAAEKDTILLTDGTTVRGMVENEGVEFIKVRMRKDLPTKDFRPKDIERIQYAGMSSGAFAKGSQALSAGDFEAAAEAFGRVATNAVREWEQAYGGYAYGNALEKSGDYAAAADAFVAVIEGVPEHKIYQDAAYRAGVALARSDRSDKAQEIADALVVYGRDVGGKGAKLRADAIGAAIALAQGDFRGADKMARTANRMRYKNGPEAWYHWNQLWTAALLEKGDADAAVNRYTEMFNVLSVDPVRRSTVCLQLAQALIEKGDDMGALVYLSYLDSLPFGTQAERTVAAYQAGRIVLARAETAEDSVQKANSVAQAKLLLETAVSAAGNAEAVAEAEKLLATIGGE